MYCHPVFDKCGNYGTCSYVFPENTTVPDKYLEPSDYVCRCDGGKGGGVCFESESG